MKTRIKMRFGVTLIELMITILIATIVMAGIGVAMVDSIKSFPVMNERAQGSVVTDAYVARATFDRICRMASVTTPVEPYSKNQIALYYYSSLTAPLLDRYAKFTSSGNLLTVTYGIGSDPNANSYASEVLATTVDANYPPKFEVQGGSSVIMSLRLKRGNQAMTVTSAAVRHNDWP